MTLHQGFQFNQGNLQDYTDCHRRFQLRYIMHQAWPAVEAEPYREFEQMIDQGSRFHQIVRQHLSGVDIAQIERFIGDDEIIESWWRNYVNSLNHGTLSTICQPGNIHYEEIDLSVPIGEYRLVSKYDLLVILPDGQMKIFDWKTSKNHPKRRWMADRLQTHVYPFVLSCAMPSLNRNIPIEPDNIEMIYWFTNYPEQFECFTYNHSLFVEDKKYLADIISSINLNSEPIFHLTSDEKRCRFCTYRSLCDRGEKPGEIRQLEDWSVAGFSAEDVSVDYDQIGEIEF